MRTDDRTEEQVLVMRAQRGEQDAFRVLVERYQGLVYTLALRMVARPEDAEDAAQEAFLAAWKALPKFPHGRQVFHLALPADGERRHRPAAPPPKDSRSQSLEDEEAPLQLSDPAPGPEEHAQAAERRAALQRAISALSENHRKILLLRAVNGLDYQEIGQMLELTPGTVKSRLARARRELRDKLIEMGNYFPAECV